MVSLNSECQYHLTEDTERQNADLSLLISLHITATIFVFVEMHSSYMHHERWTIFIQIFLLSCTVIVLPA